MSPVTKNFTISNCKTSDLTNQSSSRNTDFHSNNSKLPHSQFSNFHTAPIHIVQETTYPLDTLFDNLPEKKKELIDVKALLEKYPFHNGNNNVEVDDKQNVSTILNETDRETRFQEYLKYFRSHTMQDGDIHEYSAKFINTLSNKHKL